MLRRVEPGSATVWIALREPSTVRLTVHELGGDGRPGPALQAGRAATAPVGERLHVAAVTSSGEPLAAGGLYGYDLALDGQDGPERALFDAGILHADPGAARALLTYGPGAPALPSFALSPARTDGLRVLHGSCRRPHGAGPDLLAAADGMIEATVADPAARPHLLFLTGDQIYADNVADVLLEVLSTTAAWLLGREEVLPGVEAPTRLMPPGTRGPVVRDVAGLRGEDATTRSHLLSFGEFCAMYLFAWSEALWPPDLATGDAAGEEAELAAFRRGLPRVRRALANVPVFTMWDDHEATDGWFISMAWARDVLARPLGRHVLTNAFAAFAIFQAWGNTPERFLPGTPGAGLLRALGAWDGTEAHPARRDVERHVGLPEPDAAARRLHPGPDALEWSYAVEAGPCDVVVLDTRTRRGYPETEGDESPGLLGEEALDRALPAAGADRERPLLVVSPAPLVHVPFARLERADLDMFTADRELWENRPEAFRALLERLAEVRRRVVVLCGDVHLGFTVRMVGRAGDADHVATIVQAASSPLKNETEGKRRFHAEGYELVRGDVLAEPMRVEGLRWTHAMEFLLADDDGPRVAAAPAAGTPYPPPGPGRDAALAAHLEGPGDARAYRGPWGDGKEVVGANNLGEITFRGDGPDAVVHELWWHLEGDEHPFPLTRWVVPFE
jgi:hypothetical protein